MRVQAINDHGEVVHDFASQLVAQQAGFSQARISRCINDGGRHKGLKWQRFRRSAGRQGPLAVEAVNEAGEVLYSFPSMQEAQQQGFSPSCISRAIRRSGTHQGLSWRVTPEKKSMQSQ